jgi:hypothetical protein
MSTSFSYGRKGSDIKIPVSAGTQRLLGTTLRVPEFQDVPSNDGVQTRRTTLTGKAPARLLVIPIKPNARICALTLFRKERVPMCKGWVLILRIAREETRRQFGEATIGLHGGWELGLHVEKLPHLSELIVACGDQAGHRFIQQFNQLAIEHFL